MGGSKTLEALGLYEKLGENNQVFWHWKQPADEARANAAAVSAALASAGEGLNLILNGSGGKTAATLGYLTLELLAALAARRLARRAAAMDWEERREPGADIGL